MCYFYGAKSPKTFDFYFVGLQNYEFNLTFAVHTTLKLPFMTMKKLLSIVFSLCLFAGVQAQSQHPLMGVWQQQTQERGGRVINLPVWKLIQGDGTFCTMLIINRDAKTIKSMEGSYTILSDSTYAEHVTASVFNPELKGKASTLHYKFITPDQVVITYQMPGALTASSEIWARVKLEVPPRKPEPKGPDASDLEE